MEDTEPKTDEKINLNKTDFIFASRYEKKGGSEDDTFVTLIGHYFFSFVGKFFFKLEISDILYNFVVGDIFKATILN